MGKFDRFLKGVSSGLLVYLTLEGINAFGFGINATRNGFYMNSSYSTKQEVRIEFEEEKKKMNLGENVQLNFLEGNVSAYNVYNYESKKSVVNVSLYELNKFVLKHELCHAKNFSSSWFPRIWHAPIFRQYEEWRATSCALEE